MKKMEIDFILGLPSFNFVKNMMLYKTLSQKGPINCYLSNKKGFELKVYRTSYSNKTINKIKNLIFPRKKEKQNVLLINKTTGYIYGIAEIKKIGGNALFQYSSLFALRNIVNLYSLNPNLNSKNWFKLFNINKTGGNQNVPHFFDCIQSRMKKEAKNLIDKIQKSELILIRRTKKTRDNQLNIKKLERVLKKFSKEIRSKLFIHESEIQHELLKFLINQFNAEIFSKRKLDIFNEFPQYKKKKKEYLITKKRFDVVILNRQLDEPEAYIELKIDRGGNTNRSIKIDYEKIKKDAFYNRNKYFKLIAFSYTKGYSKILKQLPKKIKNNTMVIRHIVDTGKETNQIDEYIQNIPFIKYED